MTERLYSTYQVADLLNTSSATVKAWLEQGLLPCRRFAGGPARIEEGCLIAFLRGRGMDVEALLARARERADRGAGRTPAAPPAAQWRRQLPAAVEPAGGAQAEGDAPAPAPVEVEADGATQIAEAVLRDALRRRAGAIHLEPAGASLRLRLRIDGVLQERASFRARLPAGAGPEVIARLKSMAGLPAGAAGRAGELTRTIDGREVRFRLACWPVVGGERVVVRPADPSGAWAGLADLHLPDAREAAVRELLRRTSGLVLVAARSRRERAAALWAMARAVDARRRGVVAIAGGDAPAIEGVSIGRPETGSRTGAAEALDAAAGQDADVVLIDDIREPRAAARATDLAAEGRLLLAGVAAGSAAGAIVGFADLCGNPPLLATALLAAVVPRTARRLCEGCKRRDRPDAALLARVGLSEPPAATLAAVGCRRCGGTGYDGLAGLWGLVQTGRVLARAVRLQAGEVTLGRLLAMAGATSLPAAAMEALRTGATSLAEVARILPGVSLADAAGGEGEEEEVSRDAGDAGDAGDWG